VWLHTYIYFIDLDRSVEGLEDEISLDSRTNSSTFTIVLLSGSGKSYQNKVEVEVLLNTLLGLVICVVISPMKRESVKPLGIVSSNVGLWLVFSNLTMSWEGQLSVHLSTSWSQFANCFERKELFIKHWKEQLPCLIAHHVLQPMGNFLQNSWSHLAKSIGFSQRFVGFSLRLHWDWSGFG
jgi:hypothetical protein